MGDDFDLFPKRENLDPFSFGKKEKQTDKEKEDKGEELFGQEEKKPETGPDLPIDLPHDAPEHDTPEVAPAPPDLPLGDQTESVFPPADQPMTDDSLEAGQPPDLVDEIIAEGPITESKTFDEPVFEQDEPKGDAEKDRSKRSPSPFLVVTGALVIVIGILYGALTYLKKDKPRMPSVSTPPVSVTVPKPKPVPPPVKEPEPTQAETGVEAESPAESPVADITKQEPGTEAGVKEEAAAVEKKPVQEQAPPVEPAPVVAAEGGGYSVQVGALILDSSVAELENKLRGLGYKPFEKVGSTTAMMNMLTVGPFDRLEDARTALTRLRGLGVESNLRRRENGSAIINAGSYLLEENASNIMKKIRSLGYPVSLAKREARLPMTFVRVGRYSGMEAATAAKDELNSKGLEGIVVKLQ